MPGAGLIQQAHILSDGPSRSCPIALRSQRRPTKLSDLPGYLSSLAQRRGPARKKLHHRKSIARWVAGRLDNNASCPHTILTFTALSAGMIALVWTNGIAKPSGDHIPLGGFVLRQASPCQPARETTGSARCEMCLTVVMVAKIRTTQNAPTKAENINRGSMAPPIAFNGCSITSVVWRSRQSIIFPRKLTQPARESGMEACCADTEFKQIAATNTKQKSHIPTLTRKSVRRQVQACGWPNSSLCAVTFESLSS
jgi:hypothetical protein